MVNYVWTPVLYYDLLAPVLCVGDIIENVPYWELFLLVKILEKYHPNLDYFYDYSNLYVMAM